MTEPEGRNILAPFNVACPKCGVDVGQACTSAPIVHVERSNRIGLDLKPLELFEVSDPTTNSIEAANIERARLRADTLRLSQALVAAHTDSAAIAAERDRLREEVERLKTISDTMFVEGYDQALGEIRDHFRKAKQIEVVAEIEAIWMKDKLS